MRTFWIVWCESSKMPPTYKHDTREGAMAEAERLANTLEPGLVFHVMELVDSCKRVTVTWLRQPETGQDEIPF